MRNKTITLYLLGLIVLTFATYFIIQKTLFPSGEPIKSHLNDIIQYAQKGKWEEAEDSATELMKLWDGSKYFIALNYAEADYSLFIDNLARLKGAIQTRDEVETVNQALATLKLWENFIRFIPEP